MTDVCPPLLPLLIKCEKKSGLCTPLLLPSLSKGRLFDMHKSTTRGTRRTERTRKSREPPPPASATRLRRDGAVDEAPSISTDAPAAILICSSNEMFARTRMVAPSKTFACSSSKVDTFAGCAWVRVIPPAANKSRKVKAAKSDIGADSSQTAMGVTIIVGRRTHVRVTVKARGAPSTSIF